MSAILEETPRNVKYSLRLSILWGKYPSCRGESGEEWLGGPLWSPAVPEEVVQQLSTRSRLFVTSILLCLALGATIFCAVQTIQAIQRFQQTRTLAAQGDVSTIQPWMTIRYVSRFYSVPESYLIEHLNITDSRPVSRVPFRTLAVRYNRSLDGLIRDLQTAIKAYRKQNPHSHSFTNLRADTLLALERSMT